MFNPSVLESLVLRLVVFTGLPIQAIMLEVVL